MTEALDVGVESTSFIVMEIVESQFGEPIADKFSPGIQVRETCSRYKADPQCFIEGQGVFGIPSVLAHKYPKFIGKRLPS